MTRWADVLAELTGTAAPEAIEFIPYTGTWGTDDTGFSADLGWRLDPEKFVVNLGHYPAQGFGTGMSMDKSCEEGRLDGIRRVRARPPGARKIVLSGYSQGAIVAWLIAMEFLPGGELEDYWDDLLWVIQFGDPTCPDTRTPAGALIDGWGITRYVTPDPLRRKIKSYRFQQDMYPSAPLDTYLHLGFLALKGFEMDFMSMIQVMMAMIQNDEFVDAIAELLPLDTLGLTDAISELTGITKGAVPDLIASKRHAPAGGVLGGLLAGNNVAAGLGAIPIVGMGAGFLGGFIGGLDGLGQFGQIAGGLLGGGSGSGGTTVGWKKMGKTFACLLNFATTNAHGRYYDHAWEIAPGLTCVDHAANFLNAI